MDKKVSIIVPVYHVADFLEKCIISILTQTYYNIELILVDDGGDDECPAICDMFAEKDSRVKCVHKANGGQSMARKAGVEVASGDYFMFVDGDDWLEATAVSDSLKVLLEHDADVVCFGYKRVYENNVFETSVFSEVDTCRVWNEAEIPELQRRIVGLVGPELTYVESADRLAPMWGKLYKADVVAAGKWVSEREVGSSEDALFNLYALAVCKRFVYVDKFLYCYRKDNEQSTTKRYRKDLLCQWEILFGYFRKYISKMEEKTKFEQALDNRIALSLVGLGLNELKNSAVFFRKANNLRIILKKPMWRTAYEQLDFQFFPLKWKVFFGLCKYQMTEILLLMLWCISKLKARVSK